jgi:di/tricarboxylate transporter
MLLSRSDGMTLEIAITYAVSVFAILLFISDKLRPDIIAILIMILLPWLKLVTIEEAFSGFSSNAVISVIAVMMIGYGIDKSGLMKSLSKKIVSASGSSSKKILVLVSAATGIVSSFLQNIGAAALFLPAVRRVSTKSSIPLSKLLMPMGFSAILGGTLTMVASGPLIILNDLIGSYNYERFNLFSVTPIGIALLVSGVLYFYFLGDKVLKDTDSKDEKSSQSFLKEVYNFPDSIYEIDIPEKSDISKKTIDEAVFKADCNVHIIALYDEGSFIYAPWRKTRLHSDQTIAVLGSFTEIRRFAEKYGLDIKHELDLFSNIENREFAGFAEIIIPPNSSFKEKSLEEISFRKNFNLEPIMYIGTDGKKLDSFEDPLKPGREIIVFGRWDDIENLKQTRDIVVITEVSSSSEAEDSKKKKYAVLALLVALGLVFAGIRLSLSFFTGAFIMIITGVIPRDELYQSIDWKTVFLLAGLIPLGIAFDKSGAARLAAEQMINIASDWGTVPILFVIAILSTLFSLFMSNVAATILLVPLVVIMGESFSINPRALALLVAVCASNSFVLPTHQVNAFLMTPGKYKNADFMRVGGIMSLIFVVIVVLMIFFFYL